jgi:hypothetical protein
MSLIADRLREAARQQAQGGLVGSQRFSQKAPARAQDWRWSSLRAHLAGPPSPAAIQGR